MENQALIKLAETSLPDANKTDAMHYRVAITNKFGFVTDKNNKVKDKDVWYKELEFIKMADTKSTFIWVYNKTI